MGSMHGAAERRPNPLQQIGSALAAAAMLVLAAPTAEAAGTPAGTVIESSTTVAFDLGGTPASVVSNTAVLLVDERIDLVVALQSPQLAVAAGETDRALLFSVTNTGNGNEAFSLAIDNVIAGDDFDPVAAVPAIYFDTNASGDFNTGDQPYTPGVNDPLLAADASVDVFLVNDMPASVTNGDLGRTELTASATTGTGQPGSVFAGAGDGGVNAVVGMTGAEAAVTGEYLVSDVQITVVKTQQVVDPLGGSSPLPGATITYTLAVDVVGTGLATASVLTDPVPAYTTYVPGSLRLNGAALTDVADADSGEFDTSGAPAVVVRLGDLTLADGTQSVVFQVSID
jgi:uncharacterized repeat protein (TIGR01451 family)